MKIGIIGAGNRFHAFYLDVLKEFAVVGVYNRTKKRAVSAAKVLDATVYDSYQDMLPHVDGVIIGLKPQKLKEKVALECIKAKKHVFLETPGAASSSNAEALMSKKVTVAEDFAFFPESIVQREIIASKILGKPQVVLNNEAVYAYHAIAKLHVQLGKLPSVVKYERSKLSGKLSLLTASVVFDNLVYHEEFLKEKDHHSRQMGMWKIICEKGVITDDGVLYKGKEYAFERDVEKNATDRTQEKLSFVRVSFGGKTFSWEGKKMWTRREHALYHLLQGFVSGKPVYGMKECLEDIRVWKSLEIKKMASILPSSLVHLAEKHHQKVVGFLK